MLTLTHSANSETQLTRRSFLSQTAPLRIVWSKLNFFRLPGAYTAYATPKGTSINEKKLVRLAAGCQRNMAVFGHADDRAREVVQRSADKRLQVRAL